MARHCATCKCPEAVPVEPPLGKRLELATAQSSLPDRPDEAHVEELVLHTYQNFWDVRAGYLELLPPSGILR